jgi:hypothetical protein
VKKLNPSKKKGVKLLLAPQREHGTHDRLNLGHVEATAISRK